MHDTAIQNGTRFFDTYVSRMGSVTVLDIGAQNVNGSLKDLCPNNAKYVGLDFIAGKDVDIVLEDPYSLPVEQELADVVVSSSCFEHSEMFWLLYLEIMRVLKPSGLFYLNVPSNGPYHRFPVDCWRFYPDSGAALVRWGRRNGVHGALLESYICNQYMESWNDVVCVFVEQLTAARVLDVGPDVVVDVLVPAQLLHNLIFLDAQSEGVARGVLRRDHRRSSFSQLGAMCVQPYRRTPGCSTQSPAARLGRSKSICSVAAIQRGGLRLVQPGYRRIEFI